MFGVLTYQRSAVEHRQAAALTMLQGYLKLAVEHPDLASRHPDQPVDARYEWFATHALFTAETLWSLVGDDSRDGKERSTRSCATPKYLVRVLSPVVTTHPRS